MHDLLGGIPLWCRR